MISEFFESEESEYVIKVWDFFRFYEYGFIIEFPLDTMFDFWDAQQ